MTKYYIRHTDITKNPVEIEEGSINEADFDIALFGRIRLEYGERLNQNLLNLMENFAVGMDPNLIPPTPTPMPSFSPTPLQPTRTPSATVGSSPTPTVGSSPTPTPVTTASVTPTPAATPSPPRPYLSLFNLPNTLAATDPGSSSASITLLFNSTGQFNYSNSIASSGNAPWIMYDVASNYELYYTFRILEGSTADPGPGQGVWHDLSSPVGFYTLATSATRYTLDITIRNKIDTGNTESKTVTFILQDF